MLKKTIFYLLIVSALLFVMACKGQRDVKVVISYPNEFWYGWMAADGNGNTLDLSGIIPVPVPPSFTVAYPAGTTISANYDSRTIDLGDDKSHITVWLERLPPPPPGNAAQKLDVSITEQYQPGFLYLASSKVLAESSNNTNNASIPVFLDYDPGTK